MTTDTSLYALIGGEPTIRALTRRFYDLMDALPEAAACRAVHPASLAGSEEKLFDYLTGWLGGPPVYVQKNGPPMLRARHLHAPIGPEEIEGWLICFRQAWAETVRHPGVTEAVMPRVEALARHMHNRA
ncbi:globin [Alsobacter soli]|uniref:Globin n=1 Tax=Alsobacter soli TaxID=2109933 RepID=A0A2T1HP16_9HYPH|nr:group II truncated hemoglobin [Alsobacter soli]PSC03390.1 globin [Alsobacter soli]